MDTFFKVLFQDPILLAAALVLVAAVLILLWALNAIKKLQGSSFEPPVDEREEIEPPAPAENTGLFEARLQEISNQLAIIAQRLTELEKTVKDRAAKDQTMTLPGLAAPEETGKLAKRIEEKLEALAAASNKPAPAGDSLGRLESKLEGIHKLLILLTDSGGSEQK